MDSASVSGERPSTLAAMEVRAITDSIRDYAVFVLDPLGIILSWNAGAQRLKGYTREEIIGRSFTQFYTAEDLAAGRPHKHLEVAAREGRVEIEGWRVRKDGTLFWADVVISAIRAPEGTLQGYVKVTRDLTDRRRADEELRQSELRMRLMIGSVKDFAIFMLDPNGYVATWNAGAEALKGYKESEIVGSHVSRFYLPEDARTGKAERELASAAASGRFEEEGWRVRKDGSRFWASVVLNAVRDSEGALLGFAKVTRDMTERKRAAEEVAERARQQAAVAALGVAALQTPELGAVIEQALRTLRETLNVSDVSVVRGGAPPPPGLAAAAPIHDPDGDARPYGLLTIAASRALTVNDLNFVQAVANVVAAALVRAKVEEQLRASESEAMVERSRSQRAQEALREWDDFISIAAHELRTPLTALLL